MEHFLRLLFIRSDLQRHVSVMTLTRRGFARNHRTASLVLTRFEKGTRLEHFLPLHSLFCLPATAIANFIYLARIDSSKELQLDRSSELSSETTLLYVYFAFHQTTWEKLTSSQVAQHWFRPTVMVSRNIQRKMCFFLELETNEIRHRKNHNITM